MTGQFNRKLTRFVQKYRTGLLAASCGGIFTVNILYHVFPEETYRKLYQAWHKGEPVSLSDKLQSTFQEVLKDAGVSSPQRSASTQWQLGYPGPLPVLMLASLPTSTALPTGWS
ncbi:TM177 protein, partial [Polyodon spathula]|nr:TM177 protein [Polyodon spathula]